MTAKYFTLETLMPQKRKKCLNFFQIDTNFSCQRTTLLSINTIFTITYQENMVTSWGVI